MLPAPTKEPAPAEYQVLIVGSTAFFALLGIAAIACGIMAPPEKYELAHRAICYGAVSAGIAGVIAVGFWIARRLISHS